MSVLLVVRKNGRAAIACDSQTTIGDLKVTAAHKQQPNKIHRIPHGFISTVGWAAFDNVLGSVLREFPDIFTFNDAAGLYDGLMRLHATLRKHYFFEAHEDRDQPVESSQMDGLIAHRSGIYSFTSYRHLNAYTQYWAMGSGRDYALGALHSLYPRYKSAEAIARQAAEAACAFDCNCGTPVFVHSVRCTGEDSMAP